MTRSDWVPAITGLRGLAALYVVLYHMYSVSVRGYPPEGPMVFFAIGHFGVAVFIVLSGYCLAAPYFSSTKNKGWITFFWRRFRRIAPPYYVMIGLACVLAHLPELGQTTIGKTSIIRHIFFYHNWTIDSRDMDSPMWSIATEMQIYCLMPIIIWGWRKVGLLPVMAIMIPLSFIPGYLGYGVDACMYYVASFLLGALAADVVSRPRPDWLTRLPWYEISIAGWAVVVSCMTFAEDFGFWKGPQSDMFISIATCALLIQLVRYPQSKIAQLLSSPIPYFLGLISYSLYLIHDPLVEIAYAHTSTIPWGIFHDQQFIFLLAVVLPMVILAAYVFHLLAERPFLTRGTDRAPFPSWLALRAPLNWTGSVQKKRDIDTQGSVPAVCSTVTTENS